MFILSLDRAWLLMVLVIIDSFCAPVCIGGLTSTLVFLFLPLDTTLCVHPRHVRCCCRRHSFGPWPSSSSLLLQSLFSFPCWSPKQAFSRSSRSSSSPSIGLVSGGKSPHQKSILLRHQIVLEHTQTRSERERERERERNGQTGRLFCCCVRACHRCTHM